MRWHRAGTAWLLGMALAAPVAAQGTLAGTVKEDGTDRPIPGVEILLEGTRKITTSDDAGRFHLGDLPTGNRVVLFRLIGYRPSRVRVMRSKTDTTRIEAILISERVRLDSIVVTGTPDRPRGIGREAFEERRRLGFGKFVDSVEMRRARNVRLSDVLSRLGVFMIEVREDAGLKLHAASSRRGGHSQDVPCYMGVVYDGLVLYKAVSTGTIPPYPPPDFRKEFDIANIESLELYRGAGEVPLEFGGSSASCGVIVLWSRRN